MATDSYMTFQLYSSDGSGLGNFIEAESQVDFSKNDETLMKQPTEIASPNVFEIEDYSFNIEQTLNIGSQSSGTGAGKIAFNPFSITRKIDKASPRFFEMACSGTAFAQVTLALRKSVGESAGGEEVSGRVFLRFDFKLVAIKTISWQHDEESPKETIEFEYGGLQIRYAQQNAGGKLGTPIPGGWNRITNRKDQDAGVIKTANYK
jgi:type VI secretion system Hcp family effector